MSRVIKEQINPKPFPNFLQEIVAFEYSALTEDYRELPGVWHAKSQTGLKEVLRRPKQNPSLKLLVAYFFLFVCLVGSNLLEVKAQTVPLQNGTATFSVDGGRPDDASDGVFIDGWTIQPGGSGSQTAVWETTTDVTSGTLTFRIYSYHCNPGHLLGRFRLSVTTDDRSLFADGLDVGGDVTANWIVLENPSVQLPPDMSSTVLPDNSILVSGNSGLGYYTVTYSTTVTGITGVRLEAIDDPSLPSSGPGLYSNGNFMISELTLVGESPVTFSPANLDFGTQGVGTVGSTQTITIFNNETISLEIPTIGITGDAAADFNIVKNDCPAILSASGSCEVSIIFSPQGTGVRNASLQVDGNAHLNAGLLTGSGSVGGTPISPYTVSAFEIGSRIFPNGVGGFFQVYGMEIKGITNYGTIYGNFTFRDNVCPIGDSNEWLQIESQYSGLSPEPLFIKAVQFTNECYDWESATPSFTRGFLRSPDGTITIIQPSAIQSSSYLIDGSPNGKLIGYKEGNPFVYENGVTRMLSQLLVNQGGVLLQNGTATFSQNFGDELWSPDQTVDGIFADVNGWAIARDDTSYTTSEAAVWETVTNLSSSSLSFNLYFLHSNPEHLLGRFRLSVTTDDRSTFADGLDTGGDVNANWTVLENPIVQGPDGMSFTVLADNSILASGSTAGQGVYTVSYATPVSNVTGIRLEVIEDDSLPGGNGPGLYTPNGNFALTELTINDPNPPNPFLFPTQVFGINDSGQIIGFSNGSGRNLLIGNNEVTILDDFAPIAINNNAQILGYRPWSTNENGIWQNGIFSAIAAPGLDSFAALDINNSAQVIGNQPLKECRTGGYLWQNGNHRRLAALQDINSRAIGLNAPGNVIGSSDDGYFLYTGSTKSVKNVENLFPANSGWRVSSVISINDNGQILGTGTLNSEEKYFLLTPYQALTPTGTNVSVQTGALTMTFDNVTTGGTTTVESLSSQTEALQAPGGYAISSLIAYEIQATATFSPPVTVCFDITTVNDPTEFANLRILHREFNSSTNQFELVDRTSSHDFANRRICATTTSFSPFFLASVSKKVSPLFDQSRAYKLGSTVPVKLKMLNDSNQNISNAGMVLKAFSLRRIGTNTTSIITDSGNSNSDNNFRYDSNLQGYIYNLKTTGLISGRYVLSFYAGNDASFFYTVEFEVK